MIERHLIIGAGNAGLSAAAEIRRRRPQDEIIILSDEDCPPYCRCLLTYYLEGKVSREQLFDQGRQLIAAHKIDYRPATRVITVEPRKKRALFADGTELVCDQLLLASGGRPKKPDFPGAGLPGIFTLRSFADASAMEKRIRPGARWAVVGAGLVSLKTIVALQRRQQEIELFASSPRILSQVLDEDAARLADRVLRKNKIGINLQEDIIRVEAWGRDQLKLYTSKERQIIVDNLLYGKGVNASSPLSRDDWGAAENNSLLPGEQAGDGLLVNEKMALADGLFAAGDCAAVFDLAAGITTRLALWPLAGEQGRIAGANMAGAERRYPGGISCNAFSFFGLDCISAGYRELPASADQDWRSHREENSIFYRRLNYYRDQLKGFIITAAGSASFNQLKKAGPMLQQMRQEAQKT